MELNRTKSNQTEPTGGVRRRRRRDRNRAQGGRPGGEAAGPDGLRAGHPVQGQGGVRSPAVRGRGVGGCHRLHDQARRQVCVCVCVVRARLRKYEVVRYRVHATSRVCGGLDVFRRGTSEQMKSDMRARLSTYPLTLPPRSGTRCG